MATNQREIAASPAEVFAVLARGELYDDWVVGAKRIRAVDPGWPAPGARIHHTVGVGPLQIRDSTEVRDLEPDRRMVLLARIRPLGRAVVELTLEPADGRGRTHGTLVVMRERLVDRPDWLARLVDPLIRLRNQVSLARLDRLAAGSAVPRVE